MSKSDLIQHVLQRWIDRKTHEIDLLNAKMRRVIEISEQPGITLGAFYAQAEEALQCMDEQERYNDDQSQQYAQTTSD